MPRIRSLEGAERSPGAVVAVRGDLPPESAHSRLVRATRFETCSPEEAQRSPGAVVAVRGDLPPKSAHLRLVRATRFGTCSPEGAQRSPGAVSRYAVIDPRSRRIRASSGLRGSELVARKERSGVRGRWSRYAMVVPRSRRIRASSGLRGAELVAREERNGVQVSLRRSAVSPGRAETKSSDRLLRAAFGASHPNHGRWTFASKYVSGPST